jgi:hypothetical protein
MAFVYTFRDISSRVTDGSDVGAPNLSRFHLYQKTRSISLLLLLLLYTGLLDVWPGVDVAKTTADP